MIKAELNLSNGPNNKLEIVFLHDAGKDMQITVYGFDESIKFQFREDHLLQLREFLKATEEIFW